MTSPAGQLVASPSWGAARKRAPRPPGGPRLEPVRVRSVQFGLRSSPASDAAGAALVLGGSMALWAAFLLAVL